MLNLVRQTRSALGRAHSLLSFMRHPASFIAAHDPLPDHEQKQAALGYLNEAWAEARHDGVDGDCLAQASSRRAPNGSELTAKTRWRNSWKAYRFAFATASFRPRWRSSKSTPSAS